MALTDNLVSYFKLDEAGSSTRIDSHGTNSLADVNTVAATTGKLNDAATFVSGNSERLQDITLASVISNNISVSLWHKGTVFTSTPGLYGFAPASTGSRSELTCRIGSQSIAPGSRWVSGGEQSLDAPAGTCTNNNDGNWHHYVIRYFNDGSRANIDCWYDGVSVTSVTHGSLQFSLPTYTKLYVGCHVNNFNGAFIPYLTGSIDEFAFWDRKLTDAEIGELYNGGSALAYEDFDAPASTFRPRVMMY